MLALSGKNVICVDADLRRPKLAEYLGQPQAGKGLVEVLSAGAKLADVVANVTLPYYPRTGILPAIGATAAARWASGGTGFPPGGQLRIVRHGIDEERVADVHEGAVERHIDGRDALARICWSTAHRRQACEHEQAGVSNSRSDRYKVPFHARHQVDPIDKKLGNEVLARRQHIQASGAA